MSELNALFRQRIGIPDDANITFESLDRALEQTAYTFPFENRTTGRTHVTILVTHDGQTYVIDTGFGGNLPLKPVPLTGETVASNNGQFRIARTNSVHGDFILEMKLKHKNADWRTGYAFDSGKHAADVSEFTEIQTIITEHPESPFNKAPLITRLTNRGSITLTSTSFTQWADGIVTKETFDGDKFKELSERHFGL